jgi:hypothetical protein
MTGCYDSDYQLHEYISECVDDVLNDPNLNADDEVRRIISVAESAFWTAYNERRYETPGFVDRYAESRS